MFRNILKTDLAEDVPIGEINPVTGRIYAGPKYGEIDKDEYESLLNLMPKSIDWSKLSVYEKEDNTKSSQALACTGDICEVVDIT